VDIPHSRKNAVKFIHSYLENTVVEGKIVLDLSAGAGYLAGLWKYNGAQVIAYDLYPELMKDKEIPSHKIDLNQPFPIESNIADYVVLTETIDHISEQQQLFSEVSRILKQGGLFILTKPNNSNISGRMANLWLESERADMFLPNECTVIGYDEDRKYMGRIFLIGVQKIRTLAAISGLKIENLYKNQISVSSIFYFVLIGWYFILRTFLTYKKSCRNKNALEKMALKEQYKLNQNHTILFHKHLCMVLKKV
jgi:SAM-dependent methyltransferase